MRLDEFIDDLERDEDARRRELVAEKSYQVTEYLEDVERDLSETVQGDALFGSTAPSVFVGRANYPEVSAGVLAPVSDPDRAAEYETGPHWYQQDFSIDDVFQHRTNLLNSARSTTASVHDAWDGFVGVQREVAIADDPVDIEVGLDDDIEVDLDVGFDDVATPTGPRTTAAYADLAENPSVPRPVEKTLEDDDWQAEGAMTYLYRRGFDVYDINTILSAGALGRGENRQLVPTRWSITAVDDTVGQYLRGTIQNAASIDQTEVWYNEYLGNRFWVVLTPGQWEFELVELKAPGSIWNPDPDRGYWLTNDYESYEGRDQYVEETAGAYHAARLGVLEHLHDRGRQAKALVIRHVTEDYWGPAGVWQVRETVRNAFEERDPGVAEGFGEAVRGLGPKLPISFARLRRKSELVSGLQTQLGEFSGSRG